MLFSSKLANLALMQEENLNRGHEEERRRKRWERRAIILAAALVAILTALETYLSGLHRELPLSKNFLVFSLINVNIILILLLLFLVIRNIVKLIFERRRNVLGAKLRTKLVVAFVSLSLFPGIILFLVSSSFITGSIDSWFSSQVERSLEESLKVSRTYYQEATANAVGFGKRLASVTSRSRALEGKNLPGLKDFIKGRRQEYGLTAVEVFDRDGKSLLVSLAPKLPLRRFIRAETEMVRKGLKGKEATEIVTTRRGELVRAVVPIFAPGSRVEVIGAVAVGKLVSPKLSERAAIIASSLEEYHQLNLLKDPIKSGYIITLLMVTLLVIFSATWFGIYLARGITNPIQKLAEGTRRVAEGELDFQIEQVSDDEVGYLVDSFNRMTTDLRFGKVMLERANEELKLSNLELESRRKYMEIILGNVGAGVIAIDHLGQITIINRSAEEMLAIKSMRVLGKSYKEVLAPDHMVLVRGLLRELNHAKEGYIRRQIELPLPGRNLNLLVSLTMLRDEGGQYRGMVMVLDDLTQLVKAQRMAAWREVARRIAHEIKNPLTPIQLSAQRLRKRFGKTLKKDAPIFEECTGTIIKQVDELKALVNEFSRFARMPQISPSPNDVNEVLGEALVLFREAHKEIHFNFEPDPAVPIFDLDRDQMKRAIINLLDNAVAAVNSPGRDPQMVGEVTIRSQFDPNFQLVMIEISDNGHGLPPGDRTRLFEPHFSAKEGGSGLGLAIVSSIVADHNGYVKITDNLPRGTSVIIELPLKVA